MIDTVDGNGPKGRSSLPQRVWIVIVFTIAPVIITWVLINYVANRRWAAMEARVKELTEEIHRRDSRRPILRGEAIPGNAWEDYEPALKDGKGLRKTYAVLHNFLINAKDANPASVAELLAEHGRRLEHLRRGVQRAECQLPLDWMVDCSKAVSRHNDQQSLAMLAICQARFRLEEGRAQEAAELLLDTCQFVRDFSHNESFISEAIGLFTYNRTLDELRCLLETGLLSQEELKQVARQLEILDGSFPQHGYSLLNEIAFLGSHALAVDRDPDEAAHPELSSNGDSSSEYRRAQGPQAGWRYGFSRRIMIVDAFDRYTPMMQRAADAESQSWSKAHTEATLIAHECRKAANPHLKMRGTWVVSSGYGHRECRTRLRLLRAAASYLASGQMPDLDDPFGYRILHSGIERKLRLWSVGRDGWDDGGNGSWKDPAGPDIVLEIPR